MNTAEKESLFFENLYPADQALCIALLDKGYIVHPSQFWQCIYHYEQHGRLDILQDIARKNPDRGNL